jgi:phenylpropionate dioxygenase-like ring-hydroxylating dioxygenase large terminal subunit
MLVTKQPVLRRFWYPVMRSSQLNGEPEPFQLLGSDIVLWRGANGEVTCFQDRCRHRTAKLSLGFIEDGRLVCGYHGWAYRPDGVCVWIPQRANPGNVSDSVRVPAYRAAERYGYIWVALDEPLTDIPDLPDAGQPGFRKVDQFYEPWNIGALRLMENSFDAAHIAFVHRKTFGNVERPRTDGHRDIKIRAYGFDTVNETPVKVRGELARRAVHTNTTDTVRRSQSTWYMPFVRRLAIHYPQGLIHSIVTCATPMTDHASMMLQWVYRNDTESQVSTAEVIAFDRAITLEDKRILESCDPDVPLAVTDGEEMHMHTDQPGVVMRRMFAKLLSDHGETERRSIP